MKEPEDEAFEELAKRQGDWGLQGSRKHQIMRYAENVESKGTSMTQDEIIEMAKQAHQKLVTEVYVGHMGQLNHWEIELLKIFAKLVAQHEREACAMLLETHIPTTTPTWVSYASAIRARGEQA